MKKFMTNIKTLAALLMAGAAFTACSSSDDDNIIEHPVNPTGKYTMTIKASKGDNAASTRALELDNKTLKATWNAGEEVLVYQNGSKIGTLTAAASSTAETTLSGPLDAAPVSDLDLIFYFHTAAGPSYSGQDGTLTKIASTYDFCTPATVAANTFTIDAGNYTVDVPGGISFGANKQAIVKFTLMDKADGTTKLSPSALTVSVDVGSSADAETKALIQAEAAVAGVTLPYVNNISIPDATYTENGEGIIYLAIPDKLTGALSTYKSNFDITLTATVGSDTYKLTKSSFPFENGKYYSITAIMTKQAPSVTDLSMVDCAGTVRSGMWTANCYMIHTAGDYKLPLVYGNAIKNGAANTVAYNPGGSTSTNYCANFVNHAGNAINAPWITKSTSGTGVDKGMGINVTSAELLWQDAQGLITAVGIDGDYLTLTVGKDATTQEGNALVAAKNADGTIVWSWHIWVTKQTFATLTAVNAGSYTYQLTPVNIGWVGEANSNTGYCTYYQWGRKDAFIPSTGTGNVNHTVYDISNSEVTGFSSSSNSSMTIGGNIQNPMVFNRNNETNGPCNTRYFNMWDAQQARYEIVTAATKKTVYDPCPSGFCIPTIGLYNYIASKTTSNWSSGYIYSGVFFPTSGWRRDGSGTWEIGVLSNVGSGGEYWSATHYNASEGRIFGFGNAGCSVYDAYRAFGSSVRAVAE